MAPVVVGDDARQGEPNTNRRDDEEDLGQVRRRFSHVDPFIDRQCIERGDGAVERHTGDHDDDSGDGERHPGKGGTRYKELSQQSDRDCGQPHGELPRHMENVDQKEAPGIGQCTDHSRQDAGLGTGVEQHGKAVGCDEGAEAPQNIEQRPVERSAAGCRHIPAEDEGDGPYGHARSRHHHEHIGAAR